MKPPPLPGSVGAAAAAAAAGASSEASASLNTSRHSTDLLAVAKLFAHTRATRQRHRVVPVDSTLIITEDVGI